MSLFSYHNHKICVNVGAPTWLLMALCFAACLAPPCSAQDIGAVPQADRSFLQAAQQKDAGATSQLLAVEFSWINSQGKRLTRTQFVEQFPSISNADISAEVRVYGNSAFVRASKDKVHVLRVWTKSANGWKLLLYQEVTQVEKSEPVNAELSGECLNPCKEIPFQSDTPSKKAVLASWQGAMKAMAENDASAYSPLIAEEFTATDTFHDRPYSKTDRLEQIARQKASGRHTAPPELLSADMFDLGETVLMIAREQRKGAKPYFNSRMWVLRDARWQMLFSFNTRIE